MMAKVLEGDKVVGLAKVTGATGGPARLIALV